MSNYFDNPALSQSKLKEFKKSPKHYWSKYVDPERKEEEPTEEMKFGKALHCSILEPDLFKNNYMVIPKIDKRTKDGKAEYASYMQLSMGKEIISDENLKDIELMNNVLFSKDSSKLLKCGGLVEHELYWRDNEFDIDCKAKLDVFIQPNNVFKNGVIVDIKTTQDATPDVFTRSIDKYGYYNQAAFYCNAVKQIYNTVDLPMFIIIAMEKTSPYEINFFELDNKSIKFGIRENKQLMSKYKECLTTGNYHGYEDKINSISLPAYKLNKKG